MNRNPQAQADTTAQPQTATEPAHTPDLEEVIDFCRSRELNAEKVGGWVWVSFDEAPSDEIRRAMKELGFRWSPRRKKWAHNCGTPSKSARVANPWEKYSHQPVSGQSWKAAHA